MLKKIELGNGTDNQIVCYEINPPSNYISKAIFYVACVNWSVPGLLYHKFTKYQKWGSLSKDEIVNLLKLCKFLTPSRLLQYGVAQRLSDEEMEEKHKNCLNTFEPLTYKLNLLMIDAFEEKVIGFNRNSNLVKWKLYYTDSWINEYYYTPLKNLERMLDDSALLKRDLEIRFTDSSDRETQETSVECTKISRKNICCCIF